MKPLENIKIIDFTITHAGTHSTMLLAAFGAEVIKVEPVGGEDPGRKFPPLDECGNSGYFSFLNKGKRGIAIDITKPAGQEVIKKLVAQADVVVENFRNDYLTDNNLGYDVLKEINPQIIYASLTGYGNNSPREGMAALEIQLQSMCGISSISGYEDGAPVRAGVELACHVGGTYLATAICIALINAKKRGIGQRIDISMIDSLFSIIEGAPIEYTLLGAERKRTGNAYPSICPYDTFLTKNGSISIGVCTDRQWQLFCEALYLDRLASDPRYITNEERGINYWTGLRDAIQSELEKYNKEEVESLMKENRIPCGVIKTVAEAMESNQVRERGMLLELEDIGRGEVKTPGIPIKIYGVDDIDFTHAPAHGQDTEKYLKCIGYSNDEISKLIESKIAESI